MAGNPSFVLHSSGGGETGALSARHNGASARRATLFIRFHFYRARVFIVARFSLVFFSVSLSLSDGRTENKFIGKPQWRLISGERVVARASFNAATGVRFAHFLPSLFRLVQLFSTSTLRQLIYLSGIVAFQRLVPK